MPYVPNGICQLDELSDKPFFIFRKHTLKKATRFFQTKFKGKILYAVKTNPELHVLKSLFEEGITAFDVASLAEVIHINNCFGSKAELFFMHPIKSRKAISEAYHNFGVKHFVLDSEEELTKILQETNYAKDLCLHVRLAIPNSYAELDLSAKFGVNLQLAPALLKKVRQNTAQLGLSFHVGSQCMHPDAYRIAIRMSKEVLQKANIPIDFFNVGGGFPSIYPGMIPPPLANYFDAIHEEFFSLTRGKAIQLLAEPGRALVAESTSLIVRVELRKRNKLYINDGTYGSLFDAGVPHFVFPVKLIGTKQWHGSDLVPYSFYGPTCDSLDYMKGPFYLPSDIQQNDYIEIGQIGAYGRTMASEFNGFSSEKEVIFSNDEPLMTLYEGADISESPLEVIAA